jgi:O-antigen biosynthesis protein WbqL
MPILRRILPADRSIASAELLWRPETPAKVTAAHESVVTFPDLAIISVEGAIYGGMGMLRRDGQLCHEHGLLPDYFEIMTTQMGLDYKPVQRWLRGLLSADLQIVDIATPALVAVHGHWNFGHFLMEILPRLLVLDRDCPPDWPILMAAVEGSFLPGMVRLACPDRPIVTFDPDRQGIRAPMLVGCGDLITPRGSLPALQGLYAGLRDRLVPLATHDGPVAERVFLSRAGVRKRRHVIANRPAVEAAAEAAGYLVVRPEDLPWPDQARLFARARIIAGEYGSALHNAIFAPPGTTIVGLNWINAYQSQIAALMGHRIGYLRPADGQMRDSQGIWRGDRSMRFDPAEVTARLQEVG